MAQQLSEATAALTSAVTAASLANGRPPEEVVIWSILGALVAVWLNRKHDAEMTPRWVVNVIGTMFVSVLSGIVGSAMFIHIAADIPWVSALGKAPQWTSAFVIAALIHTFGPMVYGFIARWLSKKGGPDASVNP